MIEVVLHAGKEAKFGVEKVNGGHNIRSRDIVLEMGGILKNKLSPLRVKGFRTTKIDNRSIGIKRIVCYTYCVDAGVISDRHWLSIDI